MHTHGDTARSTRIGVWATAAALAAAVAVHLLALYLPGTPDPGPDLLPHLDKVVHVALFAVPTFLIRRITTAWWPVALAAVHAPVSELVQHSLVPYRSGDALDLVADLVGVALGLWLARPMTHTPRPRDGTRQGAQTR